MQAEAFPIRRSHTHQLLSFAIILALSRPLHCHCTPSVTVLGGEDNRNCRQAEKPPTIKLTILMYSVILCQELPGQRESLV